MYLFPVLFFTISACEQSPEPLKTPLEEVEFEKWTTHSRVVEFTNQLAGQSNYITVQSLGNSVEGREIPYLKVTAGQEFGYNDEKLTALIYAQQHGDEPSGNDALLTILRNIANGEYSEILEHLDLIIVPQVNPDGAENLQRHNAANVDLNRSHLILDGKETRPLRQLFHRWEPEIAVDVHEYQPWSGSWMEHGFIRLFDEEYGLPTNVNTAGAIRNLAEGEFLPYIENHLNNEGFTFHNYLVGNPESIRYSTSNINDGRQGFGIFNTFSLILEGRRAQEDSGNIRHRTEGQVSAITGLLQFSVDHKDAIASAVHDSRKELINGEVDEFILTMKREQSSDPLTIPVLEFDQTENGDYVETDTIVVEIENYYPLVTPARTVAMPEGYLIPSEEGEIAELMRRHQVEVDELDRGEVLETEVFRINNFTEEQFESPTMIPTGVLESRDYEVQSGDIFVPTSQLSGLMIATALEAQSMHGLIQYEEFDHLKQEGEFPIYRVVSR